MKMTECLQEAIENGFIACQDNACEKTDINDYIRSMDGETLGNFSLNGNAIYKTKDGYLQDKWIDLYKTW